MNSVIRTNLVIEGKFGGITLKKLKILMLSLCIMFLTIGCAGNSSNQTQSSNQSNADSKPITLKYAVYTSNKLYPGEVAQKWAELLEQRTNGRVKIDFYFDGTLLEANNMYDGILNGVADIGIGVPAYEPGRFPLIEISDWPSGFPNVKVASQVVSDLVHEFDQFKDFKVLKVFTTEPSYIQSKSPIASLKELKGQQLRIAGALIPMLTTLGASGVGMTTAEQAQALQTGIISGYVSSRGMLMDGGFAEYTPYYTEYPFQTFAFVAVMNKKVWDSLPPDVQQAIDKLSKEMPVVAADYEAAHLKEVLEWGAKKYGVKGVALSADEKSKWDELIAPLQAKVVKKADDQGLPGSKYRDRLNELIKKYSEK